MADEEFGSRFCGAVGDEAWVEVAHIWKSGEVACEGCGRSHVDIGVVAVEAFASPDVEEPSTIVLTAAEALMLAELLRKAVGWVIDETCEVPDIERQARRFSPDRA